MTFFYHNLSYTVVTNKDVKTKICLLWLCLPILKCYKNHRSVEWVGIYVSLPCPLSLVNSSNSEEVLAELSAYGRLYNSRKAPGGDLRMKIIQNIIRKGGDFTTGSLVGSFSVILKEN